LDKQTVARLLMTSAALSMIGALDARASESFDQLYGFVRMPDEPEQPPSLNVHVEKGDKRQNVRWEQPSGDLGEVDYNFSLNLENDGPAHPSRPDFAWRDQGQEQHFASVKGAIRYSDWASMKFDNTLVEERRWADKTLAGFDAEGDPWGWGQSRNVSSSVSLGFLDDRLRLTRRQSLSRHDASQAYIQRFAESGSAGDGWLSSNLGKNGFAVLERFDADILRSGDFSFSVFGLRNSVNKYYEPYSDNKNKSKRKDDLDVANRRTSKYGVETGFGPFEISLAEYELRLLEPAGPDSPGPVESGYEAGLSVDVSDLRGRIGDDLDGGVSALVPASLWVKYAQGDVESHPADAAPRDGKFDLSFGGAWYWQGVYADLSYWHSVYDTRRPGAEAADWVGDGLDLGAGYSSGYWGFDTSVSLGQYQNLDPWSESEADAYDASLSAWMDFHDITSIKSTISLGSYEDEYRAYDGLTTSDYLEFGFDMDLGRYLSRQMEMTGANINLGYRLRRNVSKEVWSGAEEEDTADHETVFVSFDSKI
jgi:hypothetical protein